MVDEPHILIQNRTKSPLATVLSVVERALKGRNRGGDLTKE
jgi:hypothetical protein